MQTSALCAFLGNNFAKKVLAISSLLLSTITLEIFLYGRMAPFLLIAFSWEVIWFGSNQITSKGTVAFKEKC